MTNKGKLSKKHIKEAKSMKPSYLDWYADGMSQADESEIHKSWYPLLWLVLILIILWRLV